MMLRIDNSGRILQLETVQHCLSAVMRVCFLCIASLWRKTLVVVVFAAIKMYTLFAIFAGEMAECARQLVLEPYLVLLNDVRSSSHYVSEFWKLKISADL